MLEGHQLVKHGFWTIDLVIDRIQRELTQEKGKEEDRSVIEERTGETFLQAWR